MNNPHQNARLTVYGREQIVARVAAGQNAAEVAQAFGVSVRTVRKWLSRFREGGAAALQNRSSAPRRVSACLPQRALVLIGRLAALDPPEPVRHYSRDRPGELLHLDIKKLGRFEQPGHRVTRTRRGCRDRGAGWDFVHVTVDDASRLAYVEVLPDERKATTTGFLLRALRWFRTQGIKVERVMTDNGSAYRSRRFRKTLRWLAIRHIYTPPCTPILNGAQHRPAALA